ncbi:MAG: hypothetical protein ACM3UR_14840 [Bacteroidota bacterium]|jgi:hypothetical protein|nr:hypothetical protein [Ignavibacteria bacterium]MCU7514156.1 hypothetical protein [Ignavibacteria bacterium]MCU7522490.1 hypothetical protein [Ignavibacteria bacterium]MCU7525874.1 hypothetical protein [Ignavibacteria bacterium]
MKLSQIIFYISITIWLLPPLKQFRGKFFYYFLIQAISDPVAWALVELHYYNLPFYVAKDLFLILCLWNQKETIRKVYVIIPVLLLIHYLIYGIDFKILALLISVAQIGVLYFIFKMATDDMLELKRVKIFYIVIILYELSVILKFIISITSINLGMVYFYVTTAFEILLGIFFIFVSERNERFSIAIPERNKAAA